MGARARVQHASGAGMILLLFCGFAAAAIGRLVEVPALHVVGVLLMVAAWIPGGWLLRRLKAAATILGNAWAKYRHAREMLRADPTVVKLQHAAQWARVGMFLACAAATGWMAVFLTTAGSEAAPYSYLLPVVFLFAAWGYAPPKKRKGNAVAEAGKRRRRSRRTR